MSQDSHAMQVPPATVPDTASAVNDYEQSGGSLTRPGTFGVDPLEDRRDLDMIRYDRLINAVGSFDDIFFKFCIWRWSSSGVSNCDIYKYNTKTYTIALNNYYD